MEVVKAEKIIFGATGRAGVARNEVDGDLFLDLRDALSRRLREGWEFARWPELMRWEKRYFRPVWSAAVTLPVAAGSEWYHPDSESYYVALQATSAEPSVDGEVDTDWAELLAVQSADDWDETVAYDAGDKVFYPVTETFYVCHTATTAGIVPTTAANWGAVPELDRYVEFEQELANGDLATAIGTCFAATRKNPKTVGRHGGPAGYGSAAGKLTFWRSEVGIQIDEMEPWAWLEFRIRPPALDGELWDVSTAYEEGEFCYFDGDFYECIEDAAANESPETHAAKWELKEIPLFLERFLVTALYADYLEMDGQKEKADAEEGRAYGELGRMQLVYFGQEEESPRAAVGAR